MGVMGPPTWSHGTPIQHRGTPNSTVTGTPFNITGPPTQLYMDPQEKEGGEMWGHGTPTTRLPLNYLQQPPAPDVSEGKAEGEKT